MKAICPTCDFQFKLKEAEESEIVTCKECGVNLVVKKVGKKEVILEEAPAVEEDWGE